MADALKSAGSSLCFGGDNATYKHESATVGGTMTFSIYLPPQAREPGAKLPALLFLSGLTCDHTTFITKAGAQRTAARHGLILVAPDTSPRHVRYPGDRSMYDFGMAAGYYVDATQAPWREGYRMASYVSAELPDLVERHFPVDPTRWGVCGHSVGGHGALTLGLRHPERFKTVSAFAPMVAPATCPWGTKAFTRYLGADRAAWAEWDATELVKAGRRTRHILVDQGAEDQFLEKELRPELFAQACAEAGQPLKLRMQPGYDHSYYMIQTFMEDHVIHHVKGSGA